MCRFGTIHSSAYSVVYLITSTALLIFFFKCAIINWICISETQHLGQLANPYTNSYVQLQALLLYSVLFIIKMYKYFLLIKYI